VGEDDKRAHDEDKDMMHGIEKPLNKVRRAIGLPAVCEWHAKGQCAYQKSEHCNKRHPQTGERLVCPKEKEENARN
jgi:hypothetical protein